MINALLKVMNRFLRHIFLVVTALIMVATVKAQENMKMLLGVGFDTFFDNTEYTGTNLAASSGTIFSARLTPKIGIEWNEKNSLVIGADLYADFGNETKPALQTELLGWVPHARGAGREAGVSHYVLQFSRKNHAYFSLLNFFLSIYSTFFVVFLIEFKKSI